MKQLRMLEVLVAGMLVLGFATPASAQPYPTKPIRLVAPFPPGTAIDILSRLLGPPMGDALGQTIVVENKVGAGGNIGVDFVVKSPKDGYTIGIGSRGPLAINTYLVDNMPYDPVKDVAPVSLFGSSPMILWVSADSPAKTLRDFVQAAQARPGKLNYASDGIGTTTHLAGEALRSKGKIDLVHVPYKGTLEAATGLTQGDVQIFASSLPPVFGLYQGGKIRPIAAMAKERLAQLPDVPTVAEAGFPGAEVDAWFAMYAPAGTPPDVIAKIRDALGVALAKPDVKERFKVLGITPQLSTPQELAKVVQDERAQWGPVINASKAMKAN
ncbi:MAG: tripartite tricarboxylate transporter substrate binding protein [Burkholderiales bacterium]|nr:tripartite tricarboxylate transporter substrate binding protein [Burkholderiales bacterium]